ncbi:MAG TPA: DctP family TRAP transporter solute-binding subunit [Gammaproteobacteria bacterium]|nr:DctP family TRAP transporter solute-binding subunit [Gammaproteobacteria bacterium]
MTVQARVRAVLLGFSLAALSACGGSDGAGATASATQLYVIKFPHVVATATPKGQMAQRFKELAEERFPGRVRVEVYPSAQLMEDTESIEALAFGEVQMIATSVSLYDRLTQKFQVFDLPFLFPNLAAVERFQASAAGRELLTTLVDQGILGLQFWHNGMKQFTGPRPLIEPDDARGLKFRVMESDILQAEIEAIGGSPQKMAFGEVYQALQTGTVDAQENTWSNIYSSKFYEIQPYMTESNHGYIGYFVAVNAKFWQGLPDDLRTGLESTLAEVTQWGNARSEAINQEDKQRIIDSKRAEITVLTPLQLEAWQAAMRPVWDEFRDRIGGELVDAALAAAQ